MIDKTLLMLTIEKVFSISVAASLLHLQITYIAEHGKIMIYFKWKCNCDKKEVFYTDMQFYYIPSLVDIEYKITKEIKSHMEN